MARVVGSTSVSSFLFFFWGPALVSVLAAWSSERSRGRTLWEKYQKWTHGWGRSSTSPRPLGNRAEETTCCPPPGRRLWLRPTSVAPPTFCGSATPRITKFCTQVRTAEKVFLLRNRINLLNSAPYTEQNTRMAIAPSRKGQKPTCSLDTDLHFPCSDLWPRQTGSERFATWGRVLSTRRLDRRRVLVQWWEKIMWFGWDEVIFHPQPTHSLLLRPGQQQLFCFVCC